MTGVEKLIEQAMIRCFNWRSKRKTTKPSELSGIGSRVAADGTLTPFELNRKDRLKHLYVLGSTGSGKTNLIAQLIEEDIARRTTVAILDLRGDLFDRVLSGLPESFELERLHMIDLRRPSSSEGINPFQCGSDPFSSALQMHGILKSAADSWGVQLDETLRCCLIALSFARRSLADLPLLLTNSSFRSAIVGKTPDPNTQAFFERFDSLSGDRQGAWILPVLNKVSPFLSHPTVRSVLSERRPIDLRLALDTPGSVVLCALAADRLHGLAGTFGCLMVNAIETAVSQRVDQAEHTRNPVHLYLDEFENFQSTAFESIIAEGRRFRLGLTLSHQNLHQLDSRLRHVVTNNAATRIYFRTGHLDAVELGRELSEHGVKRPVESLLHLPIGEAFVLSNGGQVSRVRFRKAKRSQSSRNRATSAYAAIEARSESEHDELAPIIEKAKVKHIRKPRAAKRKESGE